MVYLIHFDKPYAHFQHYAGVAEGPELPCEEDLFANLPWMRERLSSACIAHRIARAWPDRGQEWKRRLRTNYGGRSGPSSYCPECRGEAAFRRGALPARRPTKYPGPDRPYIRVDEQTNLCLKCPLLECVGIESPRCPIRIEQRRRKREYDNRRRPAGYRILASIKPLAEGGLTSEGLRERSQSANPIEPAYQGRNAAIISAEYEIVVVWILRQASLSKSALSLYEPCG
jgi:hypothetical protein